MKKYTHVDHLLGQNKKDKKSSQQTANQSYPNKQYQDVTGESTLRKEGMSHQNQREVSQTNRIRISQRTLNQTCRSPQPSPSSSISSAFKAEKSYLPSIEEHLEKLKQIQSILFKQILELQQLLDNTSHHIEQMDQQYFRIKHKILEYTARTLDTSFNQYKEQSPKWSQYQQIEKKGLQLLGQIQEYIKVEENIVNEAKNGKQNGLKQNYHDISNRTVHYSRMVQQISKVKEDFIERHPTLHEARILRFQSCLAELCKF